MDFKVSPISNTDIKPTVVSPLRSFWNSYKYYIIAIIVIALVAIGISYYFLGRNNFSEGLIDFKLEGPTEVTSGELVTYKINYKNNNQLDLSEAKINFFFPTDALVVKDGNISAVTNETLEIGSIKQGESGEKTLTAYIIGDKGNIKIARAGLTYKPANVSSLIRKDLSSASTITTLSVPITVALPPTALNGQTLSYLIDYRNQSQQDFSDLRFKLKYPDGFKYLSASPQPTDGQNSWNIKTLKQSDGSRISVQGTINGAEREIKNFSLVLQKKITTPAGDSYIDFEKIESETVIASPLLSISLSVNDSENYTAHLGDGLSYIINFKNNSTTDISGLTLSATLSGSMFDLTSVNSNAFFDSRTNSLTWSESIIPELGLLRPGQSGSAAFSVRLKNAFVGGVIGAANSLVKISAHLETTNIPANLDTDRLSADNQLITRISGDPAFDQRLTVGDSQFGTFCPFPPRVNKKTNFTVRWNIINPSSDLSPAKVTAVLPPGVKWENTVRISGTTVQPVYDSRLGTITWDLGVVAAGSGVSQPKPETYFVVSITPSVNQINQTPVLLKTVRFEATDFITKEKITRSVPDISTYNTADNDASGAVQE